MLDMGVSIGSLRLSNPVGVASGTFGYGQEYSSLVHLDLLGALYTKAVTLEPREGNPPPRLVETPSGLINSIGLANPGLEGFLQYKLPYLESLPCSVIVNIAGSSETDYLAVLEGIEEASAGRRGSDAYEVNVSCPNVSHGGMAFGTDPSQVERLTRQLRANTKKPLIVKLSPNVTDIAEVAKAAEAGGADAVSCINTIVGMAIDTESCQALIARGTGGLSGPAIRPIGVACVFKVARAIKIPVIGLGGIASTSDALQYLLAGAVAIQIGTALFSDPGIPGKILVGIEAWMVKKGVERVDSIRTLLR